MEMEREPIESVCDWDPSDEILNIVDSHELVIPSRIITLEDFLQQELEKEEREKKKLEDEKIEEMEEELELGSGAEEENIDDMSVSSAGSVIVEKDDATADPLDGDDDFAAFAFAVTKPQVDKSKKTTFADKLTLKVQSQVEAMRLKAKQEAEEALHLKIVESTENFLDKLIGMVVETSEYVDPDDVLREKIDKDKLFSDVTHTMSKLNDEYRIQSYLNATIVRYFWRKNEFRHMIDEKLDQLDSYLRRYHNTLMEINHYMAQVEPIKKLVRNEKREMQSVLKEVQTQSESRLNEFVDTVKKCFGAGSSEKIDKLINTLTMKMTTMWQEMSKIRFKLIQKQHTLADLKEQSQKLEDLGNGLCMHDYQHLITQTLALAKKIEERNKEINRLRQKCTVEIHLCAHVREKQKMDRSTIMSQEEFLDELFHEKQSLREDLHELRRKRLRIRRELKKHSFNMGLAGKPELLADYDETVDKINNLRKKLADMRAEQKNIAWEIDEMVRALQN